jgi:hypothetical protein
VRGSRAALVLHRRAISDASAERSASIQVDHSTWENGGARGEYD